MAQKSVKVTVCLVVMLALMKRLLDFVSFSYSTESLLWQAGAFPVSFSSISCSFPEACGGNTMQCLSGEDLERVILAEDALCVTPLISLLSKCLLTRGSTAGWDSAFS